ncbi:uncharacterized protein LOC127286861 isoform X1 [Leptopilina boulardi]|uniref:uncharacterized protein LOC127286861 isoform X1 n=1 Tax=Leptopilina boulardi TaxID=63433 RepID=UPI0021F515ED|nr:uncharacterized protein LOC127286861 isoform X1 [Leptopilina boulardi]
MDITETPKNLKNPEITEQKSTFVEKNSSNDQYDQHLNIDLKATESNFKKLVIDRQKERGTQHLLKENDKIAKLADLLKKTKQLLKDERVKNENLNEVITSLKSEVQQLEEKLVEAESYSERIMKLNEKWQALSMNKYAAIHDMFDQIINHQDFRSEEIQLQPGYITEDRSFIHMGRGEWISYATYLLSMNGVTYKSRKTFPRNLCVAVFGYDLLRKCTVTGEGSNRNGNVKKPTEKLDPNKVLAIKDIYKHFLINELGLNKDDAESESCQLNKIIAKKIAFIKGLYQKNKTDARPLLGENG